MRTLLYSAEPRQTVRSQAEPGNEAKDS
jgi:hypothetical protein